MIILKINIERMQVVSLIGHKFLFDGYLMGLFLDLKFMVIEL